MYIFYFLNSSHQEGKFASLPRCMHSLIVGVLKYLGVYIQ